MEKVSVNFRFKGSRRYVHGPDLYNQLLPILIEHLPPNVKPAVKLTFHGMVRNQCDLWIRSGDSSASKPDGPKLEMSLTLPGQQVSGWLTENSGKILEEYDYDEEQIRSLTNVSGKTIRISEEPGYSPVEVVVAMNKKLLESVFPEEKGKWIFTRLQLIRPFEKEDLSDLTLKYELNLPRNTLTRTRIKSGGKPIGTVFFSSVR